MPPRIQQLSDDLVAKIAAGEVVERPASVLKELIENSLDADADQINIVIEGAGRTRLQISDNGYGMTKEEAIIAIRRHATSKISRFEDLYSISSYGFRGEALPSIASVSRFRLTTRSAEEDMGWEIDIEGSKILSQKPVAREPGTTMEVRDLFFNTPARFKFLKTDSTERSQCLRVIEELAFAALHVSFNVKVENAKPIIFKSIDSDKSAALHTRIVEAWGSRLSQGLERVQAEAPQMALSGWVTNPGNAQNTTRSQILFVNGRPVQNRRVTRAIYEAYRGQLPSLRHPGWVLNLNVNPAAVDVNVHPSKREVKLTFENEIFGFVMGAVQKALSGSRHAPAHLVSSGPASFASTPTGFSPQVPFSKINDVYKPLGPPPAQPVFSTPQEFPLQPPREQKLKAKAQMGQVYILCESKEGLTIMDQHAAHEKIIYERLFSYTQSSEPEIQMLLVPFSWEVSKSMADELEGRLGEFQKMGFVIEPFGESTFVVKGYPRALGDKFDMSSLLDSLSDIFGVGGDETFTHRLAAMAACKSAVKAGDTLDLSECQHLVDQLFEIEAPFTCPHGRPTFVHHPFTELNRKFQRT